MLFEFAPNTKEFKFLSPESRVPSCRPDPDESGTVYSFLFVPKLTSNESTRQEKSEFHDGSQLLFALPTAFFFENGPRKGLQTDTLEKVPDAPPVKVKRTAPRYRSTSRPGTTRRSVPTSRGAQAARQSTGRGARAAPRPRPRIRPRRRSRSGRPRRCRPALGTAF